MAFGSKNDRKKMLASIMDEADGEAILGQIDNEIQSEDNRSQGLGAKAAGDSLSDTYENISSMKRSLGERKVADAKASAAMQKQNGKPSVARDWLTYLFGQEEADAPEVAAKREELQSIGPSTSRSDLTDKAKKASRLERAVAAIKANREKPVSEIDRTFLDTGVLTDEFPARPTVDTPMSQDPDSIRTDAERIEDTQYLSGSGISIEDRFPEEEDTLGSMDSTFVEGPLTSADDVPITKSDTKGLMSRPYDKDRMKDINELPGEAKYPTVTKYLESNDITPADDTVDLATDLAVTNNQFTNRTQALETIQDTYSYADATTSQAFSATIAAESSAGLIEGTNYSRANAIEMLGGNNTARIADINALFDSANNGNRLDASQQEELFNIAYGGRMGNANNEGYKYRGRGLIQITGKAEYLRIGKKLGIGDTLVKNPDLLLSNPSIMLAATKAYLDNKGFGTGEMTANTLKDAIGHSGGAVEAEARWNTVLDALEADGETEAAERGRLTNEFTAQRLAGTTVDGDIRDLSIAAMTTYLSQPPRNITVPAGATAQDIVILVNETAP